MKIQESAEDYLEMILILSNRQPMVRSIDIANEMHFSKPSVSHAMKLLRENNYVTVDGLGGIHLTEDGMAIANRIYERHTMLTNFLMEIGVEEKTAKEDACRLEHDLSMESFAKLKEFYMRMHQDGTKPEQ